MSCSKQKSPILLALPVQQNAAQALAALAAQMNVSAPAVAQNPKGEFVATWPAVAAVFNGYHFSMAAVAPSKNAAEDQLWLLVRSVGLGQKEALLQSMPEQYAAHNPNHDGVPPHLAAQQGGQLTAFRLG